MCLSGVGIENHDKVSIACPYVLCSKELAQVSRTAARILISPEVVKSFNNDKHGSSTVPSAAGRWGKDQWRCSTYSMPEYSHRHIVIFLRLCIAQMANKEAKEGKVARNRQGDEVE